jgi:hypothetical protein
MAEIEAIEMPDATTQPQAYREALLAVIGDRDPLEVMAATPGRVLALTQGRGPGELERPAADGEWSARDVIGHLVDVEIVYGFRCRLALTADRPSYPGYDEKLWSRLPRPPAAQLCGLLEGLRAYNLVLLRSISRAQWSRVAVHEEQGEETVEVMIRKVAGHDLAHLNQLERALAR